MKTASRPKPSCCPLSESGRFPDQTGNPAPAATPSAFNTTTFGMTRLDAQFAATNTYRVAVADYRGDGRPDYFYQARLLYSDTVTPSRISLAGGIATLGMAPDSIRNCK